MAKPTPFGVFDLHELIGEGGMGEVFRAVHREQGVEVAIKVLRTEQAAHQHVRDAFLREAQSVARMLHSGIVRIIDYGEVPPQAHEATSGRVVAGCPYIAMEFATRGSLHDMDDVLTWRQLRWMLIEILNALAHAHARGLVHRDLKPDNVLITTGRDDQTQLKLTDFGIVHITDPVGASTNPESSSLYAGTPVYMAPEQLRGQWRDFGPWTDLYALGCVAFEQCTGVLPFDGESLYEIAYKQLAEDLPELNPRMTVPDGFEAWLRRLFSKEIYDRFQRASDAAWALAKLPEVDEPKLGAITGKFFIGARAASGLERQTWSLEVDPQHAPQNTLRTDVAFVSPELIGDFETSRPPAPIAYRDAPPMPESWHRTDPPAPSIQLIGAGLGLYGLRQIPYVSRVRARDTAWSLLRRVHALNAPHALLVRGPTGIGKTHFASWISERAHEVGAATILHVQHAPETDQLTALARMVERKLQCAGLDRKETFQRLQSILSAPQTPQATIDLDALALTELLRPGDTDDLGLKDPPSVELHTARARSIVLAKLLEHLCRERPVILWLEDAHWSPESIDLARL
ncbi:MAG: serine/threonine-protein kinase, partial [Myxococcota bacterium]